MAVKKEDLAKVQKLFGKGSIMKLGDRTDLGIERIPTGSLELDLITGGGWPLGRIIEIFGPESSGKTTVVTAAIAQFQKAGKNAGIVDVEHAFDPNYAERLGVDINELIFTQPDNAEQALDIAVSMIRDLDLDFIAIDSTSALTPKAEIEGEMTDNQLGLQARLLGKGVRKLTAAASQHNCTVVFISQIREKIGVLYGSPEKVGVGNSVKFAASIRLDIRRGKSIEVDGEAVAHCLRMKTIKNKTFPPFRKTETVLKYNVGFDLITEVLNLGVEMQIIERRGSHYHYGDIKLGNGVNAVTELLEGTPELLEELEVQVRDGLKQQD